MAMDTNRGIPLLEALLFASCVCGAWMAYGQPVGPGAARAPDSPGGLSIRIVPLKAAYAPGEVLDALVYLAAERASPVAITVDGTMSFGGHLHVHLLDRSGREVEYRGWNVTTRLSPARESDFIRLYPGYIHGRAFSAADWTVSAPRAGTYELYATVTCWEDGHEYGLRAWTGTLESNRVKITVAGPRPAQGPP